MLATRTKPASQKPSWQIKCDFRAILDGDERAIRRFVYEFSPCIRIRVGRVLWRFNSKLGAQQIRQETEDLCQETFVQLFANGAKVLRSWDPEKKLSLANFVGLIAERTAFAWLRSGRRNRWRERPMESADIEFFSDARSSHRSCPNGDMNFPERQLASRETLERLLTRIQSELPPNGLKVFYLAYVEQCSSKEVCDLTNLKPDTVYSWRSRLMKKARAILSEIDREDDLVTQGAYASGCSLWAS